jgi:hypothetical protein
MDDIAWERGRNADDSSRAVLTPPRGPGLLSPSSPSGSGPIPSAAVLALPASATSQSAGLLASSRLAGDMDGGGETLLVRRSKGKKRPQPAAPAEEGSGSGGRFRALWRDYHDLLQVSVASRFLLRPLISFALSSFRAVQLFRPVLDGFTAGLFAAFLVFRSLFFLTARALPPFSLRNGKKSYNPESKFDQRYMRLSING